MKKLILCMAALFILSGCAGTVVKVLPMDVRDTIRKVGKVFVDPDYETEVTLIRIEF